MKTLSILGLIYCAVIWGGTFFIVKDVLSSVHPITLVAYRFILSALILLPFAIKIGIGKHLKEGLYFAFFLALLYITQTLGLKYTTASNSGFITGLFVIFIPIILRMFKIKKITGFEWVSAVTAVLGLWILTGGIDGINKGDILTLIAAPSYAAHVILVDRFVNKKNSSIVLLTFHQFWITGIFCLLLSGVFNYSFSVTSTKAVWVVIFLAVFPTLSAFFIQMWAQRKVTPIKAGLIFTLEPVFAAAFAWTIGGELVKQRGIIGGLLIMIAIIISELSKLKYKKQLITNEKEPVYEN